MSVLASLLMAGCSQEEFDPNGENDGNGEVITSYMAVNLVSSDVLGTRATGGDYEDGSTDENSVSKVRFYFFDGTGGIVNVKPTASGAVNYYDWENPATITASTPNDVEKILKATIVINTKKGDGLPVRIAAVINPDNVTNLGSTSLSLSSLKDIAQDYATSNLTSSGKFVMFNSVYLEGGKDYSTTDIKTANICTTEAAAEANPVDIYVERSVAKISVALGENVSAAATADGKIALKDGIGAGGENILVEGKQVYLHLGGWELAAETDKGRLIKKINPGWEGEWWKGNAHRTFWAINYLSASNVYDKSYTAISNAFGATNYLYTNENAGKNDINSSTAGSAQENTKVIVKGELVDADGNAFTIVRHGGARFADDPATFLKLRESILRMLENKEYFYYYKDESSAFHQIAAADLAVVEPTLTTSEDSKSNCYVYTQLTEAAEGKNWYKTTTKANENTPNNAYIASSKDEINGTLKNKKSTTTDEGYIIDRPLVWKSGMTYYYYEIIHNGTGTTATKGVVRNHIYKTTINNIAGLGTPVYNPGTVIYPEKPDPNDHYIAARINILSWRVVSKGYNLEW